MFGLFKKKSIGDAIAIRCEIGEICVKYYVDTGDASTWYGVLVAQLAVVRGVLRNVLVLCIQEYIHSSSASQQVKDRAQLLFDEVSALDVLSSSALEEVSVIHYQVRKLNPSFADAIENSNAAEARYSLIGRG